MSSTEGLICEVRLVSTFILPTYDYPTQSWARKKLPQLWRKPDFMTRPGWLGISPAWCHETSMAELHATMTATPFWTF